METSVPIDVLGIDVRSQLDQSLHVFNMHRYGREMESCGILPVDVGDSDVVTAGKDKDREDTLVALSRAVHHCLVA